MAQRSLEEVPSKFRCPGGAVAVIREGELAGQHAWGFANIDQRIPMTTQTIFPICSISKQMVCLLYAGLSQGDEGQKFRDAVDQALRELLPQNLTANKDLTPDRLMTMQSGIRDYWALTVLWGATPSDRFSIYQDAPEALRRLGNFHFAPGTLMSYSNSNFMVLGLAIEKATGKTLSALLDAHLFKPAGMSTATLRPDTARLPPPCVGYEGSEDMGYIPYQNRIEWAADAGVQASLEDMIAYEKFIDRAHNEDHTPYATIAKEASFIDGNAAFYGYGLTHATMANTKAVGHSGGLAGFRLRRLYSAEKRVSVMVMLNSESDPEEIAEFVLTQVVDPAHSNEDKEDHKRIEVSWTGHYLNEEASLAVVVKQDRPGELSITYGPSPEKLKLQSDTHASSKSMDVTFESGKLSVKRPQENHNFEARRLAAADSKEVKRDTAACTGTYYSSEIDSTFRCYSSGSQGLLYGSFDGYLGKGPVHLMRHVGENVWLLACHRSLDAPAPGNWTVVFDDGERPGKVTIGCWLARNIEFTKTK